MPEPQKDIAVPKAAIDHMSLVAQEHLPELLKNNFLEPEPPPPPVIIHDAWDFTQTLIGTTGEYYFVVDTNVQPSGGWPKMNGFEVGVDKLVFTNLTDLEQGIKNIDPAMT